MKRNFDSLKISAVVHPKLFWSVLLVTLFSFTNVTAQLKRIPLERPGIPAAPKSKESSSKRTKNIEPLLLPFFDDFSSTPVFDKNHPYSGFPSEDRWESSFDVWVNEGLGIDAPSINVATLDGLDSAGRPYSNDVLENGYRDILTSRAIDMSTVRVGVGERPGVYLSFFYQWQGNGEPPDANDYFRVEFLTADSTWIAALTVNTLPTNVREEFIQAIVQVNGDQFFHDKFRFRFRNYGRLSGPYDTWNLDYIYLNKGRNETDLTYADRAIASGVGPVFGEYYSVPVDHFRQVPIYTPPQVDIKSLRSGPDGAPTDYQVLFSFYNYTDGALTEVTMPFGPVGSKFPDNNLQPGERFRSTIRTTEDGINVNDPGFDFENFFRPEADRIDLRVSLGIYEPDLGVFAANDTVSQLYHLDDYYAYDDGTAEYAVVLSQADDQVACRFDVIPGGPQQLVGFDVYIPAYSLSGYTTAEFFVMDAENGEPNERIYSVTSVIRTTPRNGFQRVMIEPVAVEGQFFIGWKGSFSNQVRVGLDYSNNTVSKIYEDFNGVIENGKIKWYPVNSLTEGTIMIRPNFGEGGPISGIRPERNTIKFYPNPSAGVFYVDGKVEALEITSVSGQRVFYRAENEGERTRVSLEQPQSGLYIIHVRNNNGIYTGKLVVY